MPYSPKRFGWIPDIPDQRDHLYAAPIQALRELPKEVDLRAHCPPVYDQGQLGSCTANAIGAAVQFDRKKQELTPDFIPSRLFLYYNERAMEGTIDSDSGAMIRDGIKSMSKLGDCPEDEWPYEISHFRERPPAKCYTHARKYKAVLYQKVARNLNQMKGCLATGYPFVYGFTVYDSFDSQEVADTGNVPMPATEEQILGGHAVLAVGYDDTNQRFTVRNSWGTEWGMQGYFTMPYAYLIDANLADDFWTVRLISG